jgi:hypothetical protein
VLSLTGTAIPGFVLAPLELLGAMAVPSMLVAYRVALRTGGRAGPEHDVLMVVEIEFALQRHGGDFREVGQHGVARGAGGRLEGSGGESRLPPPVDRGRTKRLIDLPVAPCGCGLRV